MLVSSSVAEDMLDAVVIETQSDILSSLAGLEPSVESEERLESEDIEEIDDIDEESEDS